MARLPTIGGDNNAWGTVINDFLSVALNTDGSLKSDSINPKNPAYGAIGNGSNDDTTGLQAAFTAAVAGVSGFSACGKVVLLPYGNYKISAPLVLNYPIMLLGLGWGTTITLANGSNCDMIQFNPQSSDWFNGAVIANIKLDGNGDNQTSGGHIVNAKGAVWCLFDHVWFRTPWGSGLYLHDDNLGGYGHHNMIDHCFFDNGSTSNGGDGRGVYITGSDENMVTNSTFQECGRAAAPEPNAYFETAGLNSVVNCKFVGGATGIKLQGSRSLISLNHFDGCKNHNVRLNGSGNIIETNWFYNIGAGSASNTIDGIWVDNIADTRIVNNGFMAYNGTNGSHAFVNLIPGPPTNTYIAGNNMSNVGGGTLGTSRIAYGGTGHDIRSNLGYNPVGPVSAPTMPASTVAYTNNLGSDATVFVAASGATITAITIGGTATGITSGSVRVPARQTIALTYSGGTPTWTWFLE